MALSTAPYFEYRPLETATLTAGATRFVLPSGLGACNQITVRLVVGDVTGGSDALDVNLHTSYTRDTTDQDIWITGVVAMTQATAATTETKYAVRSSTVSWSDRMSVLVTVAAGATATGVSLTIVGANQ